MKKIKLIVLVFILGQCFYIAGRTIVRRDQKSHFINTGIAAMTFIQCFGDSLAESIVENIINSKISNPFLNDMYILCDNKGHVLRSIIDKLNYYNIYFKRPYTDSLVTYLKQNQVVFWVNVPKAQTYAYAKTAVSEWANHPYVFALKLKIVDKRYVSKEKYKEFCVNHKLDTVEFKYFDFYKHVMDSLSKIPEDSLMRKWGFYD